MSAAKAAPNSVTESTTTVVIGSGFSALAVAAELNRRGVEAVVLDSLCGPKQSAAPTTGSISLADLGERSEILRLLENYARRHELDIRCATTALELLHQANEPVSGHAWRVRTATGTLSAHSIVFTRGALSQLRRVLQSVGVATGDVHAGMAALGLYLVGVGDLALPSTQEILHQAKRASASIKSRTAALSGDFAFA